MLSTTEVGHFGHTAAFGADHLHHFAGLFKLFEESVDVLNAAAGTVGNTLLAAAVDTVWVLALIRGHGGDHSLDGFEGVVANLYVFGDFVHAWNHTEEILHGAHLLDLIHL